jgi:hypothetical protein
VDEASLSNEKVALLRRQLNPRFARDVARPNALMLSGDLLVSIAGARGTGMGEDENQHGTASVHGDRPLSEDGKDLLGFNPMAEQLARALVDRGSKDGIVVGLEGEWGSGKSSLLALTTHALKKLPAGQRPAVLAFKPWLIGSRDALLASLFDELARTVDAMQLADGSATRSTVTAAKDLSKQLRKYGGRLGSLAPLASLASDLGLPGVGLAAGPLKWLKEFGSEKREDKPLADTKIEIDKLLAGLPRRIVVTIDDVDRLEPSEIAEVLRLVRSVADFQNIVYVLCYDGEIVAQAVKTAMSLHDGRAYLEKIVQVVIRVPAPEPFMLRRMFTTGLREFAEPDDDDGGRRLAAIIDYDGGQRLKTPRAVNRILDALRFLWPSLQGQVDLADLVWLQMVHMTNRGLYSWVELYCANMAAVASGRASVDTEEARQSFEKLNAALLFDRTTFEEARWRLTEILPGIGENVFEDQDRTPIFERVSDGQRLAAIGGKRLASPDHSRLYFALAMPAGAARETDFIELWAAADAGKPSVTALLTEWFEDAKTDLGTKGEMMLDRLRGLSAEALNEPRSANILLSLADVLDNSSVTGNHKEWGGPTSWREATRLMPVLRQRIGDAAEALTLKMFIEGSAIGWLVDVMRRETFAHGRFGDQRRPEHEWILSEPEYDAVVDAMHKRFKRMSMSDILSSPDPISLLFAWSQSGGEAEARALVEASIGTDTELLNVLEHMSSTIRSPSTGEALVIGRKSIERFTHADEAYRRVKELAAGQGELAKRALVIKARFDRDREWTG